MFLISTFYKVVKLILKMFDLFILKIIVLEFRVKKQEDKGK